MESTQIESLRSALVLEKLQRLQLKARSKSIWPANHVVGPDEEPAPFNRAQELAAQSKRRITAVVGGSQLGKSVYVAHWLRGEIERLGGGDYLAVTSSYDLFRLKLLPSLLKVFDDILELGRFWTGDKVFELKDPTTGKYWADRATDQMWGRIILRSAQSLSGLESATAKAAILDEAGQEEFTIEAWRAIRRRLTLNRGRILITTTLYDPNWIDTEIVNKALDGGTTVTEELDNGAVIDYTDNEKYDIALIQADSIVNPTFPIQEYEEARQNLPHDVFARFFRGRTARPRFMIYDCFDEETHLLPRFPIPDDWHRYLGLDFGAVNTVASFWAEEPGTGRLLCYRYYKHGGRSAREHIDSLLCGEPMRPTAYGGAKAEGQWRTEFRESGLPIKEPKISDVWLGINKVYACLKNKEIFFFDDMKEIRSEILDYRRKTDSSGNPTDEILNKERYHACFPAGTIVETEKGFFPIESITAGIFVRTRHGFDKVVYSSVTNESSATYTVKFSDGNSVRGTAEHPIYVEGKGFIPLDELRYGDIICVSHTVKEKECLAGTEAMDGKQPSLMDTSIIDTRIQEICRIGSILSSKAHTFIETFGNFITEQYRRVCIFTTEIVTQQTMTYQTYNWSLQGNIAISPHVTGILLNGLHTLKKSDYLQKFGTPRQRDESGISNMPSNLYRRPYDQQKRCATNAEKNTYPKGIGRLIDFVQIIVKPSGVGRVALTTFKEIVNFVERYSRSTNILKQDIAPVYVLGVVPHGRNERVYNLTTEKHHEYFANGVLVSNCDGIRYLIPSIKRDHKVGIVLV